MESAGVEVWQNVCYGGCSRVGQDILTSNVINF